MSILPACGLRLGVAEAEYRSLSEFLGVQEVGPWLMDLLVDCGCDVAGAKYKALQDFWGYSWESLILGPCARKYIHRVQLLGIEPSRVSFLEILELETRVSPTGPLGLWDYWWTVAVKKLELRLGPFGSHRWEFLLPGPCASSLFKECGWEGARVEYRALSDSIILSLAGLPPGAPRLWPRGSTLGLRSVYLLLDAYVDVMPLGSFGVWC